MKESVADTLSVQSCYGRRLYVGSLCPPDCRLSDASEGEKLARNPSSLAESPVSVRVRVGRLEDWWHLCRRCFGVAGLFAYLRKDGKKNIRQRFQEVLNGQVDIKYENATRYDKLAQVLLKYPMLLYQTELISLTSWMSFLNANIELPEEWKQPPPLQRDNDEDICIECGIGESSAELWSCFECGKWFHEMCAGYEHCSLHKEVQFGAGNWQMVPSYCVPCLESRDLEHKDVTMHVSAMRAVETFLMSNDAPFRLEQVDGDGYCIFGILETFAREARAFNGTTNEFCKRIAETALASHRRVECTDDHDNDSMDALTDLCKSKNRKQALQRGLWQRIEVEHVLLGFVETFPQAKVIVYRMCDGQVVRSGVDYGVGENELCVLEWATTEHYDRLRRV